MPNCQFPAQKWLQVKRTIARLADETEDAAVVRMCCQMVLQIEKARLTHMDTGCTCWQTTEKEARHGNSPF